MYTPVLQRNTKKKTGYVPVASRATETVPVPLQSIPSSKPTGLVKEVVKKAPSFIVGAVSNFLEKEKERRATQPVGGIDGQLVTTFIERPAKILKAVGVDFPRIIAGSVSALGKTVLEGVFGDTKKFDDPELEKILFKDKTKSWQDIKRDVDTYVNESPIATDWEKKNLGVTLAVAGFTADAFTGGGGKGRLATKTLKELVEASDTALVKQIMTNAKVPDALVDDAAEAIARATTREEVESALKTSSQRILKLTNEGGANVAPYIPVAERTAKAVSTPKAVDPLITEARKYKSANALKDNATLSTTKKTNIPKVADAELEKIAEAIKKQGVTKEELQSARTALVIAEEVSDGSDAAKLMKYVSKTTGRLPEVTGKETMQSLTGSGRKVKTGVFGKSGDDIVTELGFKNIDEAQEALDSYRAQKARIAEIKKEIRSLRESTSAARKGERLMQIARGERRKAFRALKDRYDLTDSEVSKIRGGRDLSIMSDEDFSKFLTKAEDLAENIEAKRNARNFLEGTIQEKELVKWENVRDAMKLPQNVSEMSVEQMNKLNEVLSQFKTGDEFLPVRMLQTIDRTDIAGVKTTREVLEKLAEKTGKDVSAMPIKPTEFHRTLGDRRLARQHPFFEFLATRKNESLLQAEARTIELSDELNELINAARASRKRSVLDLFVPSDSRIIQWSEAPDKATRELLEKSMTKEEMTVAKRWDEVRRAYYDYLVKRHAEKKFSRFEGTYFPHVRRGFLEAWKEDGVLKAFKEMADKYRQDAFTMEILNERTGEILPYEKWIGFSQFRTDKLIPTSNAAKAFESYITALEKARHLDEMVPEIMAYVHALTPKGLTPNGLELDTSLKKFVKEYINANKGRVPKGFFNPGGKFDVANRSLISLTRLLDLGFNFTTQVAAPIGENLMTLTMLKPRGYATAVRRLASKEGKAIVSRYRNFTGKTLWDEMSRATSGLGDKFLSGAFSIYHMATRKANELFLLGKMTDEEFKTGVITAKRLAEIQLDMSKYRSIKGLESILGRTTEMSAAKQYKSWAIPPLTATIENATELAKMIRKDGMSALASDAGKELFYSIGIATSLAVLFHASYKSLNEKGKKRTFIEDVAFKAMRDALSIYGAFDPTMWSGVRTADFIEDLAKAAKDIVLLEEYKTTGELKGPQEFKNTLTPALIRGFTKEEETSGGGGGLPSLPKLPALPKLPKLPKI